eukprot:22945-Pyramimonas_sp.AAC.1
MIERQTATEAKINIVVGQLQPTSPMPAATQTPVGFTVGGNAAATNYGYATTASYASRSYVNHHRPSSNNA